MCCVGRHSAIGDNDSLLNYDHCCSSNLLMAWGKDLYLGNTRSRYVKRIMLPFDLLIDSCSKSLLTALVLSSFQAL